MMDLKIISRKDNSPRQGEIWLFDPDPVVGEELGKKLRPALILSSNVMNAYSPLAIIIPLTSKDKKTPSHVKIEPPEGGLSVTSFAVCEQIRSISKKRLIRKLGTVSDSSILEEIYGWITDLIAIS